MLGNDVVDLSDREARLEQLHPRFDRRVLDPHEQAWLRHSARPDRDRWVLWAAKESAYKALRRLDPSLGFSPRRFAVRLRADAQGFSGRVVYGPARLSVRVAVAARFVHAVCRLVPWSGAEPLLAVRVVPGAGALAPPAASAEVRELARDVLTTALGLARDEIGFGRAGRLPLLRIGGRQSQATLSFSHHGRCAAFAVALG